MAQVCDCPEERATAVRPVPRLLVKVGVVLSDVPPLPSWPSLPVPQQETYKNLSSKDKFISVIRGGAAPNCLRGAGKSASAAG